MKKYIVGFLSLVMITNIHAGYFDRASATAYNWLGSTPLYAGYQYDEGLKSVAREKIKALEREQLNIIYDDFVEESYGIVSNPRSRRALSEEDNIRLEKIKNELYHLKLITGDVWSTRRRVVLGTLALAGFAAVGLAYKYAYQLPSEVDPNDISALKNRLNQIEQQKYLRNPLGGYIKNPAFNEDDLREAKGALKQAVEAVPYHSPDLVNLQDLVGLKKRYEDIQAQQYISGYKNPNFNTEDYAVAMKQYGKALDLTMIKNAAGNISEEDVNVLYAVKKNMQKIKEMVGSLELSYVTEGYSPAELESPSVKLGISQRLLEAAKKIDEEERLRKLLAPDFSQSYKITIKK